MPFPRLPVGFDAAAAKLPAKMVDCRMRWVGGLDDSSLANLERSIGGMVVEQGDGPAEICQLLEVFA